MLWHMNEKFKTTIVNYNRCLLTIYSLVPRGADFLTLNDISLSIGARNILRQRKKSKIFKYVTVASRAVQI